MHYCRLKDASNLCIHAKISHVVCGHHGSLTFSSPEYEILESAGTIRMTVKRSGGGVGLVKVSYR